MGLDIFDASEGVPEFYVDSARIAGNAFTIVIELGIQMNADPESGSPPPTRRTAIVRMSPQHALALRDLLVKNLAKYEELIGQTIPYPKPD
jgi:hypothetical protein